MDAKTGAFLNAEVADYKLPRLGDIGELVVEIYEPESERQRGVIGLGEPPVIGPGAAISNAVCNALGVRVPVNCRHEHGVAVVGYLLWEYFEPVLSRR